jgi:hypothetical protein
MRARPAISRADSMRQTASMARWVSAASTDSHYTSALPKLSRKEAPVPDSIAYPVKTREIKNAIADSTRWNYVPFRDDDIVVATYAKTGTTWTQQIVGQLVHQGRTAAARGVAVGRLSAHAARDPPGRHRGAEAPALPEDAPAD